MSTVVKGGPLLNDHKSKSFPEMRHHGVNNNSTPEPGRCATFPTEQWRPTSNTAVFLPNNESLSAQCVNSNEIVNDNDGVEQERPSDIYSKLQGQEQQVQPDQNENPAPYDLANVQDYMQNQLSLEGSVPGLGSVTRFEGPAKPPSPLHEIQQIVFQYHQNIEEGYSKKQNLKRDTQRHVCWQCIDRGIRDNIYDERKLQHLHMIGKLPDELYHRSCRDTIFGLTCQAICLKIIWTRSKERFMARNKLKQEMLDIEIASIKRRLENILKLAEDQPTNISVETRKTHQECIRKVRALLGKIEDTRKILDNGSINIEYTAKLSFSPTIDDKMMNIMMEEIKFEAEKMKCHLQPEGIIAHVQHDKIRMDSVRFDDNSCMVNVSIHCTEINGEHANLHNEKHREIVDSINISEHFELWRLKALEKVIPVDSNVVDAHHASQNLRALRKLLEGTNSRGTIADCSPYIPVESPIEEIRSTKDTLAPRLGIFKKESDKRKSITKTLRQDLGLPYQRKKHQAHALVVKRNEAELPAIIAQTVLENVGISLQPCTPGCLHSASCIQRWIPKKGSTVECPEQDDIIGNSIMEALVNQRVFLPTQFRSSKTLRDSHSGPTKCLPEGKSDAILNSISNY
eukprot:m.74687 g.74687  ORF g.74687 m.74687 type:complete len:627 (-) comp12473_c0_seq4:123-2003(-)